MKVFQSSRIVHLVEVVITMVFKLILKKTGVCPNLNFSQKN